MHISIQTFKRLSIFLVCLMAAGPLMAQQPDTVVVQQKPDNGTKFTGMVTDAATGQPIPGINVSIPGYSSALTNDSGEFSIRIPSANATLIISGAGFQSKEVPIKGRNTVSVRLFEENFSSVYDVAQLANVQKPYSQVVNAVSSVNTQSKWQTSAETPENYLQGKVAGLNVIRRSGMPGIGASLLLRGVSSLHATNQPLVIVDGMIYDMNDYGGSLINNFYSNPLANIDIKDIDNITVIKDAASMYGSKGANGVILITTAHAKELATKIDFSAYGGINIAPDNIPVMQADDYRIYLADALKSRGWSDATIQEQPYMNDDPTKAGYYRFHNNTNWQRETFKKSYNSNYYLKVTGGDNIAKYALSVGYLRQGGIIKNTDYTRYNTRFNADLSMTRKLTVNTNLAFTYGENNVADQGLAPKTNPLYLSLIKSPFLSTNDLSDEGILSPNLADVDVFNVGNPTAVVNNMTSGSNNYRFFGAAKFNYEFNKKFALSTLFGINHDKIRESVFIPRIGVSSDTLSNSIAYSKMKHQVQRLFSIYNDTYFSYKQTFSRIHAIQAGAGMRFSSNKTESDYGVGYNSATDDLKSIGTGVSALRQSGGGLGRWNWLNYYANVDYQLMGKYFLSMNMAMDGSSRFGKEVKNAFRATLFESKFGIFPSIGAGWLVSSENFMSNLNFVELLKLRVSYGLTGNDDIGNYTAKQYYVSQNFLGVQGLVRGNIGNPSLQWELNRKFNAGVDLSLLNERLSLSFDAYQNSTANMLTYEPAMSASGFDYILTNNSSMESRGFEFAMNSRIINRQFKWDLGMNIATYKNKITSIPDNRMITTFAGASILTEVGQPVGVFYGYKTNGVFTSDQEADSYGYTTKLANGSYVSFKGGDVRFIDRNADKIIDENDREVIGDPTPDFTGMFNTQLSWKRFSLEAIFTFSYGNDVYNYTRTQLESLQGSENQTLAVLNRWRTEGQVTTVPKASWGDPIGNTRFSDRWIEDGSYLRLRTITFKYDLPIRSAYFKYATVFTTANNLLTFTKYLGYDPEFSASASALTQGIDIGLVPQVKSVMVGVRLGL